MYVSYTHLTNKKINWCVIPDNIWIMNQTGFCSISLSSVTGSIPYDQVGCHSNGIEEGGADSKC